MKKYLVVKVYNDGYASNVLASFEDERKAVVYAALSNESNTSNLYVYAVAEIKDTPIIK